MNKEDAYFIMNNSSCPIERNYINTQQEINMEQAVSNVEVRSQLFSAETHREELVALNKYATEWGLWSNMSDEEKVKYREFRDKIGS